MNVNFNSLLVNAHASCLMAKMWYIILLHMTVNIFIIFYVFIILPQFLEHKITLAWAYIPVPSSELMYFSMLSMHVWKLFNLFLHWIRFGQLSVQIYLPRKCLHKTVTELWVIPCKVKLTIIVFLIHTKIKILCSCSDVYCRKSIPHFPYAGAWQVAGAGHAHRETGKAVTRHPLPHMCGGAW